MSAVAIRVTNLSKRFRLGHREPYLKLSEVPARMASAAAGLFRSRPERDDSSELWALKDVSFEVKQGEVVGIIGRNGAGKSTLLKILSRITRPTEGEVQLRGRVGSLLEVGTGFHPELTGRENIYLNGTILGMRKAEIARKFDEIVAFSEIERCLDTPVKHYSSGMYMRLAFAVAAHLEPEILIVDEVLAVGDAEFQKKCLGKMGEVARGGRTVLFVSHNLEAIQRICQRAVVVEKGKVVLEGDACSTVVGYLEAFRHRGSNPPYYSPGGPMREIACQVNRLPMPGCVSWPHGEPLRVSIQCECVKALRRPAIDVSFYRYDAWKLFTASTERIFPLAEGTSRKWEFELTLQPLPLAPTQYFFDVGVRAEPNGPYVVLWNHVCECDARGGAGVHVTPDSLVVPAISGSARRVES